MFLINNAVKSLTPLLKRKFSELGYSERNDLQEWLANHPDALGEKLLIIQKEFNGFSDTFERLDLLALDRKGNIVVIENKLDDSGKDVMWQALKYASYSSTLTKEQIRTIFQSHLDASHSEKNAVAELEDFFEGKAYNDLVLNQGLTQRIFLVAAFFRKEVTSTVMWLRNFNIQVHCFKVTPYQLAENNFLTVEQIIPTKDAQDYIISITNKVQEEQNTVEELQNRHKVRLEFWEQLLHEIKGKSPLFQSSNPTKDHWLVAGGANISGLSYQFVITMTNATVLINFGRSVKEENKMLFDWLKTKKDEIEAKFGAELNWERMDDRKSSRLSYSLAGVNYFVKEEWPTVISFLIENINKLEAATKVYLPAMKQLLNTADVEVVEEEL